MNTAEIALDDLVRVSKLRTECGIGPECDAGSYDNAASSDSGPSLWAKCDAVFMAESSHVLSGMIPLIRTGVCDGYHS